MGDVGLLTQEPALLFNPAALATSVIMLPLFSLQLLRKFWYLPVILAVSQHSEPADRLKSCGREKKVKKATPVTSKIPVHECSTGLEKSRLEPWAIFPLYESTCPIQHLAFLGFSLLSIEGKKSFFSHFIFAVFLVICSLQQHLAGPSLVS